ncbi:hypothetical protein G9C85_10055 [Halorubellus sp. JP-L1]|uniref:hypothetical protein n=1 Tax=Halorubellus sp. JP-L1 TaxID=2715753 RepID=UPI00140CF8F2|nr:hypothetical protein [Halorubellus sp. JP-L1]NHN41970.1 hypothetical protein [Halorubellus sp. JP-L1]
MPRLQTALALLGCLVLLAGCSGGPGADTTIAPTNTETANRTAEHTTAEPTTVGTPATRTQVPTLTESPAVTNPPDPRAVGTNFEHNPSLDAIYRRVEALRGLTAREQVNVSVHGIDIVDPETNERMQVGDPFDYPDDAAGMDETQTKALQLYSSEPVPLKGFAAAGMARATAVNVANESAYERIADDSFEILLVHEFAHTLQEQHGLNDRQRLTETTDADLAGLMLTEGDATLTAYRYWQTHDAGGANPLALRNTTTERGHWTHGFLDKTRYYGARYLQGVPEDLRNAHVRQPPDTTAEVMHPNGTLDLPGPAVTAPAPADWTTKSENRVGELTIRYALRTNGVSFHRAAAASTGWWNGSMRTFQRPDGIAASWSTRWANEREAKEFAAAWRAALENRDATRDDGVFVVPGTEHTPELSYVLVRDGAVIHIAVASTTADARSIAAASGAWNASQTDPLAAELSEKADRAAPVDDCALERPSSDPTSNSTAGVQDGEDRVAAACERGHRTNPMSADVDGDGLSDFVESTRVVGHHPRVVLPELHPSEKDVVLDVLYTSTLDADQRLSEQQVANMRSTWAGFPVDNPGDLSGVHLHVRTHETTQLDGTFGADFSTDDVDALYEQRYGESPGDGVVNMVVVSEFDVGSSGLVAFGASGGNVAVVRASESRPIVVTHELMHLVLGPIHGERDCDIANDSSHTCRGYLAPGGQAEPFLTDLLVSALNRPWTSANVSNATNRTVVGHKTTPVR